MTKNVKIQWFLTISLLLLALNSYLYLFEKNIPLDDYALDDYGSLWVINGSLADVFQRSLLVQGQTPFYYVIIFFIKNTFKNIYALRAFSLILFFLSGFYLFKLTKNLFDKDIALFAVCLFFQMQELSFASSSIRPYSLVIFFSIFSTYLFGQYLIKNSWQLLLLYTFSVLAIIYTHYLFSIILVIHLAYFCLFLRKNSSTLYLKHFFIFSSLLFIFSIPLVKQFLYLYQRKESLNYLKKPNLDISFSITYLEVIFIVLLVLMSFFLKSYHKAAKLELETLRKTKREEIIFSLLFTLIPLLFVYLVSSFSSISLWLPRYFLQTYLGLALSLAIILSIVKKTELITFSFLFIFLITQFFLIFKIIKSDSIWLNNINYIQAQDKTGNCPIYSITGYVESNKLEHIKDPLFSSFISFPLQYYNIKNEIVLLPTFFFSAEEKNYLASQIMNKINTKNKCFWIFTKDLCWSGNKEKEETHCFAQNLIKELENNKNPKFNLEVNKDNKNVVFRKYVLKN